MHIITWVAGALFLILHTWAIISLTKSQKELRRQQDFTLRVVRNGFLMNIKERTLIKSGFGVQYVIHKENNKITSLTSEGERVIAPIHTITSLDVNHSEAIEFIQDLKSINKDIIDFEKLEQTYKQ